jgi:hypothetical protein
MRRALLIALLFLGASPAAARADFAIYDLSDRGARPGDTVSVKAGGYIGRRPWRSMPVVMMPRRPLPELRVRRSQLDSPRFRVVGSIRWRPWRRNRNHAVGRLRFRVPEVRPRRYVFGLFCEPCVRGPGGRVVASRRLVLRVRA